MDTPHIFNTISADDWRRSIASAKAQPNQVLEQIRAKLAEHRELAHRHVVEAAGGMETASESPIPQGPDPDAV